MVTMAWSTGDTAARLQNLVVKLGVLTLPVGNFYKDQVVVLGYQREKSLTWCWGNHVGRMEQGLRAKAELFHHKATDKNQCKH